ncbi:SEC-C metal-binding domain-containing protein, partial [Streptomyces sp. ID05-39B]
GGSCWCGSGNPYGKCHGVGA